MTIWIVGVEV